MTNPIREMDELIECGRTYRFRVKDGISKTLTAQEFGVSRAMVRKIIDGNAWPEATNAS